jgi:hypothetical protein
MCPACMASAALVAGSVTTTGGFTVLLVKLFRSPKDAPSVGEKIATRFKNAIRRRKEHGNPDQQH